ncbi:MAG: hypothetical protein H6657_25410 [Ardenticatenaceae bacterium]|nr:hypothetical protein [Ardenticatenaceae bacterium]
MDPSTSTLSPQLAAANERLLARRAQLQAARQSGSATIVASGPNNLDRDDTTLPWLPAVVQPATPTAILATLPAHLGWGSAALMAVLRRGEQLAADDSPAAALASWKARAGQTAVAQVIVTAEAPVAAEPPPVDWVKLYPDIGLAMLRQELAAPGRLWLMLRYLDTTGRGFLRIDNLQAQLTTKTSSLRLCGRRQLRNLLKAGQDVFWTRDKTGVWLRSAAKVAAALQVEQLTGRPVALPVSALLDGMGTFRAHLYAAFHSGRLKESPDGHRAMPIARDTMTHLSGVGRSSQRMYEDMVGIAVQANFAVGEVTTKEKREKRAWQQGRALFELKDYLGQQGKKGKTYLAWQLPNSYRGQHRHRPRGRQKRINRELKDLVMQGMPGNSETTRKSRQVEKLYFPNGKLAIKVYGRYPERELYWQRHKTGNGHFSVWQQLGG